MDIVITPDTYSPIIDKNGNYIDNIPIIYNGLICPCGSRKNKIYENTISFTNHTSTKHHKNWLEAMNNNKYNYYTENLKQKELIDMQKQIITKLENDISNKKIIIDYLSLQLKNLKNKKDTEDLLDINI